MDLGQICNSYFKRTNWFLIASDVFHYRVNSLDIAPQYASVIVGIENTFATIPGIVSPILTGLIVVNSVFFKFLFELIFFKN